MMDKEHYVGHKDHKHEMGDKLHKSMIEHAPKGHKEGFHETGGNKGKGKMKESGAASMESNCTYE